MNLDFMSLKTTSAAAVRGERHKEKILERQKAQELEQVGGINISIFFCILLNFVWWMNQWIGSNMLSVCIVFKLMPDVLCDSDFN